MISIQEARLDAFGSVFILFLQLHSYRLLFQFYESTRTCNAALQLSWKRLVIQDTSFVINLCNLCARTPTLGESDDGYSFGHALHICVARAVKRAVRGAAAAPQPKVAMLTHARLLATAHVPLLLQKMVKLYSLKAVVGQFIAAFNAEMATVETATSSI